MATAGGFCERHGPYDPPHVTCPYCVMENAQRQAYGPPEHTQPASSEREPEAGPGRDEAAAPPAPPPADAPDEESGAIPVEPLGWLAVKAPSERRGAALTVRPNQTIGREGDVRFDDPRLSRLHARVTFEPPVDAPDDPPCFHLWPFGTTNPVFVNGQEIRGATPLRENDEIRLGDTLFVFKQLLD